MRVDYLAFGLIALILGAVLGGLAERLGNPWRIDGLACEVLYSVPASLTTIDRFELDCEGERFVVRPAPSL